MQNIELNDNEIIIFIKIYHFYSNIHAEMPISFSCLLFPKSLILWKMASRFLFYLFIALLVSFYSDYRLFHLFSLFFIMYFSFSFLRRKEKEKYEKKEKLAYETRCFLFICGIFSGQCFALKKSFVWWADSSNESLFMQAKLAMPQGLHFFD